VCLFDFILAGVASNAENVVEVALGH
jgi:hypothetical protein